MPRTCLLLLLLAPAVAHSQFTPKPKIALRSGHVTLCQPGNGCDEQVIDGRHSFTLQSDGYFLRVTSGTDSTRSYADVAITNQTGAPQRVNPADFRMEDESTRIHRLAYLDPSQRPEAGEKPPREQKVHDLPPPSYWTSAQREQDRKREQQQALTSARIPILRATTIAPDATVSGRVYFERPRNPQSTTVFLALPGALFEFPATLTPEPKKQTHFLRRSSTQTVSP